MTRYNPILYEKIIVLSLYNPLFNVQLSIKQTIRSSSRCSSCLVVIVGGIVGGIFTVTESAGIGVVYTLIIGFPVTAAAEAEGHL